MHHRDLLRGIRLFNTRHSSHNLMGFLFAVALFTTTAFAGETNATTATKPVLEATNLSAILMEDEWTTKSYILTRHPVQFVSQVSRNELIKTPAWKKDSDYPPLSPGKARDLALAMLHKIVGERQWGQPDISLQVFDVTQASGSQRDLRWIYLLRLRLASPASNESGLFNIIVLMDGTVVEPKPISEKNSAGNLTDNADMLVDWSDWRRVLTSNRFHGDLVTKLKTSRVPTEEEAIRCAVRTSKNVDNRTTCLVTALLRLGSDVTRHPEKDLGQAGDFVWEVREETRTGSVTGLFWVSATTGKTKVLYP